MFKVMIVDDADIMRRELRRLKIWGEQSGFVIVEEAKDGSEALQKLESSSIDLVITDIRMPRIDGIELLEQITKRELAYCVVLLSDYTEFTYARQGMVFGAFDYLGKPADEEQISNLLDRVRIYLNEKLQERDRIEKLETILEDKMELSYPRADMEQVIRYILQGDIKAVNEFENVLDTVVEVWAHDRVKIQLVIRHIWRQINEGIIAACPWITRLEESALVDIEECNIVDNWEEHKRILCHKIYEAVMIIIRFTHKNEQNETIQLICQYVLEHMEEDISVGDLAEKLFLSKGYLSEIFKKKLGITVVEYLTMIKMERAKKLIREGKMRNYEIAEKLYFTDVEYFGRVFKKYTGASPTEYRQNK